MPKQQNEMAKKKKKQEDKHNAQKIRERHRFLSECKDIQLESYRSLVRLKLETVSILLDLLQTEQKDEHLEKMYEIVVRAAKVIEKQKAEIVQLHSQVNERI